MGELTNALTNIAKNNHLAITLVVLFSTCALNNLYKKAIGRDKQSILDAMIVLGLVTTAIKTFIDVVVVIKDLGVK